MTSQLHLPIKDPRYKRPTMCVEAAKGSLDLSEDEIVAMVETGALVAWNIAHPQADRRYLAILSASVAEYQAALKAGTVGDCYHSTICPDEAINLLLPRHDKPFVLGTEVAEIFNCGSTHVMNLIEAKALLILPRSTYRRGPGGSPCISLASFVQFLQNRMEGSPYL
jgi:hypothetical protein